MKQDQQGCPCGKNQCGPKPTPVQEERGCCKDDPSLPCLCAGEEDLSSPYGLRQASSEE